MKPAILPHEIYRVEALRDYVQYGNIRYFSKGANIFMPGEPIQSLLFVVFGSIQISIVKEDGQEFLFYMAGENQIIGKLFDRWDTSLIGTAKKDSVVCFFSKEQLKEVFAKNDEIYFELLKSYTSKVNYFKNKTAIANAANSSQKVYQMFLLLCQNIQEGRNGRDAPKDQEIVLEFGMSQKLVAETIGVHPVTVSKVFNQMVRDGIIEKKDKKIYVHDVPALMKLAYEAAAED